MSELTGLLNSIEDTYSDFVLAMLKYAEKKPDRAEALITHIKSNPGIRSSDLVRFVSDQPDFFEDAACIDAV